MNAIAVQNEIHERQSTMKQVLMEILDVQDKFLVGATNKTGVLEAVNAPRKFCKLMGPNGYELDDVCNACLDDECSKSNQMWKRRSYSKMSLFG
uniref:Uncharacterized protein n=2 Tax=Caenorhabditis japonica TaxID=281687 RepID=A0A8R1IEL2_CAEJA